MGRSKMTNPIKRQIKNRWKNLEYTNESAEDVKKSSTQKQDTEWYVINVINQKYDGKKKKTNKKTKEN